MGCDDQGRRVSRQGARVRKTRPSDARFLYQGTIPRSCEEVAPDGRFRRKTHVALGRLSWAVNFGNFNERASPLVSPLRAWKKIRRGQKKPRSARGQSLRSMKTVGSSQTHLS